MLEWRETAMFHILTDQRHQLTPLAERFLEGAFVGLHERTGELIMTHDGGVVRCQDVRRLPEEKRWNAASILELSVTPDRPNKGKEDRRVPSFPSGAYRPVLRIPEAEVNRDESDVRVRRMRILPQDVDPQSGGVGFTLRCQRCKAIQSRRAPQSHSAESR